MEFDLCKDIASSVFLVSAMWIIYVTLPLEVKIFNKINSHLSIPKQITPAVLLNKDTLYIVISPLIYPIPLITIHTVLNNKTLCSIVIPLQNVINNGFDPMR